MALLKPNHCFVTALSIAGAQPAHLAFFYLHCSVFKEHCPAVLTGTLC